VLAVQLSVPLLELADLRRELLDLRLPALDLCVVLGCPLGMTPASLLERLVLLMLDLADERPNPRDRPE
jgi:hypothetical protein